jgi:O-succinylbenzoate synthase
MKISDITFYAYTIPLNFPLYIKNEKINIRKGILIKLTNSEGFIGIGEIAPLPGLHMETYEEIVSQLPEIQKFMRTKVFPPEISRLNGLLTYELSVLNLKPAVQFGLETALLQLWAAQHRKPIYKELADTLHRKINLSGLVHSSTLNIVKQVMALYEKGFRTIKIKVNRQTLENAIKSIRKIYKLTNKKIKLRIDLNRSLSIEEAVFFANEIKNCYPEFIEEPIDDPQLLIEFVYITKMPVGLDESISLFYPDVYWAKALVIKPAVIGSLDRVNEYIQFANQTQKLAVISDTYLTAVGLGMELSLAAALVKNPVAMGFGTYRWMAKDIIKEKIFGEQENVNVIQAVSALHTLNLQALPQISC